MSEGRKKKSRVALARTLIRVAVIAVVLAGFAIGVVGGSLSSIGFKDIAYICPVGALEVFLAGGLSVPRALIAIVLFVAVTLLVGKAFCGWVCPIPPVKDFLFPGKGKESVKPALKGEQAALPVAEKGRTDVKSVGEGTLPEKKRHVLDSRHGVLAGALLSAAVFGFPVFCLICPVGLVFATLLAVWRLFQFADMSWAILIFPAMLFLELLVLRKWCFRFCPISALLSLVSRGNKTFMPKVDKRKCLKGKGLSCGVCAESCPENINPHRDEELHECSKCHVCADNCPAKAITFPFLKEKD